MRCSKSGNIKATYSESGYATAKSILLLDYGGIFSDVGDFEVCVGPGDSFWVMAWIQTASWPRLHEEDVDIYYA